VKYHKVRHLSRWRSGAVSRSPLLRPPDPLPVRTEASGVVLGVQSSVEGTTDPLCQLWVTELARGVCENRFPLHLWAVGYAGVEGEGSVVGIRLGRSVSVMSGILWLTGSVNLLWVGRGCASSLGAGSAAPFGLSSS
jgi:hypothetical protein